LLHAEREPTISLSREQVRALDRRAIEEFGVPGVVLMENAGRGATHHVEEFLSNASAGGVKGKRVAIVAGAGNNGGDGYVVARHLHIRGAVPVVFLVAEPAKIVGDAAINLNIVRKLGIEVREVLLAGCHALTPPGGRACPSSPCPSPQTGKSMAPGTPCETAELAAVLRTFDLVVDAVGGTGIRGPLKGPQAVAVEQINAAGVPVIALDIPTGLDCDTGAAEGPVVRAALTVTFAARKKGFDALGAERYTGRVVVADIGVPVVEP
jgi:NAD(P)H-hydrate epimerase